MSKDAQRAGEKRNQQGGIGPSCPELASAEAEAAEALQAARLGQLHASLVLLLTTSSGLAESSPFIPQI